MELRVSLYTHTDNTCYGGGYGGAAYRPPSHRVSYDPWVAFAKCGTCVFPLFMSAKYVGSASEGYANLQIIYHELSAGF
jgi:hypothetical protein